jgi:GMP synthase-like glutamine amidotransferase
MIIIRLTANIKNYEKQAKPKRIYSNAHSFLNAYRCRYLLSLHPGSPSPKMKILLINNHSVHINRLSKALAGHQIEVQEYRPGLKFNDGGKDLVILSGGGGEGLEIHDEYRPGRLWYEDEMEFIRATDKPIVGVCMGFEVIARAYGAPVTGVGSLVLGREEVQVGKQAKVLFGSSKLSQYEAHSWRVQDLPSDFEILATSKTGIEIFRYKDPKQLNKTIIASQFHPEKGGSLVLPDLIRAVA